MGNFNNDNNIPRDSIGRFEHFRNQEPTGLIRNLFDRTPAPKGSIEAVDEAMDLVIVIGARMETIKANEKIKPTLEGQENLAALEFEREQALFEAHEAAHHAGRTIYTEGGSEEVERILLDLEFKLPIDASSVAAVAHAAMDDENFALDVFKRAGPRFVEFLDDRSVVMMLEHKSEKVRVAAVLAGAAQRHGINADYIGKYPQQAIVDAVNRRLEISGKSQRFILEGDSLISESAVFGAEAAPLATLAENFDLKQKSPILRAAA